MLEKNIYSVDYRVIKNNKRINLLPVNFIINYIIHKYRFQYHQWKSIKMLLI